MQPINQALDIAPTALPMRLLVKFPDWDESWADGTKLLWLDAFTRLWKSERRQRRGCATAPQQEVTVRCWDAVQAPPGTARV